MAAKKQNSNSASSRGWMVAGALALFIALVTAVWNAAGDKGGDRISSESEKSGLGEATEPGGAHRQDGESDDGAGNLTRSSRKRPAAPAGEDETQAPRFPHVQQILSDESLSEHQAAENLLEIVRRTELGEPERYEALAHGLNLDQKLFVDLTKDPQLPARFARRCYDELVSGNKVPQEQIEVCLNLMNHGDEEIRKLVVPQLAFLIENEALESSPDELRRVAVEKLESLRAAPPVQEEAILNSIDINEVDAQEPQK